MKKIHVSLGHRSYNICLGDVRKGLAGVFSELDLAPSQVLLIADKKLERFHFPAMMKTTLGKSNLPISSILLRAGENQKNIGTLTDLYTQAARLGVDRKTVVVALGGGVLTDMAGFFAATYMRGLPYLSIPTTLLGMVDAAIGGKTGVDLKEGKNLVGAFWQPKLVWIDPMFLTTLPDREWKTGMAEVVKYGVIKSGSFFTWLETLAASSPSHRRWPSEVLEKILLRSAQIKADVVSNDERETPLGGGREILNFGHTLGHALEAATHFKTLTHGEAVSIGMIAAGRLALQKKLWHLTYQNRLESLLQRLGLPVHFPILTRRQSDSFWSALKRDKKNISGTFRFVLPVKLGEVIVQSGITKEAVAQIILELIRH